MLFRVGVRVFPLLLSVIRGNVKGVSLLPRMSNKRLVTSTVLSSVVSSGVVQRGIKGS